MCREQRRSARTSVVLIIAHLSEYVSPSPLMRFQQRGARHPLEIHISFPGANLFLCHPPHPNRSPANIIHAKYRMCLLSPWLPRHLSAFCIWETSPTFGVFREPRVEGQASAHPAQIAATPASCTPACARRKKNLQVVSCLR